MEDKKDSEGKLNPRQARFASEYALTGNGTQSVINAGYSNVQGHSTANRLLKNPAVRAAVNMTVEQVLAEAQINPVAILQNMREIMETCGNPDPKNLYYNPAASLKASDLLCKVIGMFKDEKSERLSKAEMQEHIDNINKVVAEILIKYIPNPEKLKLAAEELDNKLQVFKPLVP